MYNDLSKKKLQSFYSPKALVARRKELGLTQMQLATIAQTSLPTIQNIEAGKANPAWRTMESVLAVLGLTISISSQKCNLDCLISLGLPVFANSKESDQSAFDNPVNQGQLPYSGPPTTSLLLKEMALLATALKEVKGPFFNNERLTIALQALLLAISTHYPTFYRNHIDRVPLLREFLTNTSSPTGTALCANDAKVVKLRKVALARLAAYL